MNQEELNERMYEAIDTKSVLAIEMLLEQGAEFNSEYCTEPTLQVLLINAAFRGYAKVVKSIVDTGININFKDSTDMSPLHIAAWRDEPKIVQMLIEAGADVNMKGLQDMTPFQFTAMSGKSKSARILLEARIKTQFN